MPLFENTTPVDYDNVTKIVLENWNLILGKCIKASQNHTFFAKNEREEQFIIRVTPDTKNRRFGQFKDEMSLILFLHKHGLGVCPPIPSQVNDKTVFVIRVGDLNVSAFAFAKGKSLPFPEFQWMTDEKVVTATGKWLGKFHSLSKQFSKEFPEIAARMRIWNTLHEGVMLEYQSDELDLQQMNDPNEWGILHGDVNPSNWFYCEEEDSLYVFDWDQCQQGWFMLDVAQCCHAPCMLKSLGMPVSGDPVPEANPNQYISWIMKGYESTAGEGSFDKQQLERMEINREEFYKLFCVRAQNEFVPPDMKPFIDYVARHYN